MPADRVRMPAVEGASPERSGDPRGSSRRSHLRGPAAFTMIAVLGLVGCANPPVPTPAPAATEATRRAATPSFPKVTKVLVFVVENHSLAQMKTGLPYTFSQARKFGYATHYRARRHPSSRTTSRSSSV